MNAEQLRFFYNEVIGLFDWSEDDEAVESDPLDYVRAELKRLRNKPLMRQYSDLKAAAEKMKLVLEIIQETEDLWPANIERSNAALEAYEALK